MKMMGPFFVKENGKYKLAECCENCAFGDEHDCFLNECIAFVGQIDEDSENLIEEARFEGYCEGYNAHESEVEEDDTH
jgi:hypothetical protein